MGRRGQRKAPSGGSIAAGVACTLLAALVPAMAAAGPGDLDTTFGGGDGRVSISSGTHLEPLFVNELEITSTGATYVLTTAPFGCCGGSAPAVVRFTPDGSLDSTWNGGSPVFPIQLSEDTPSITIGVDSSNRLIVATGYLVVRYTAGGDPDSTFSGDGMIDVRSGGILELVDIEPLAANASR